MEKLQIPRVFALLGAVGLLIAANRFAPGVLQAVLLLVLAYVVLTHIQGFDELVKSVPRGLSLAFAPNQNATPPSRPIRGAQPQ